MGFLKGAPRGEALGGSGTLDDLRGEDIIDPGPVFSFQKASQCLISPIQDPRADLAILIRNSTFSRRHNAFLPLLFLLMLLLLLLHLFLFLLLLPLPLCHLTSPPNSYPPKIIPIHFPTSVRLSCRTLTTTTTTITTNPNITTTRSPIFTHNYPRIPTPTLHPTCIHPLPRTRIRTRL